ncbi:hypothetical protein BGZ74_007337 [Mortierella antarctica]|nr:hypothetical protein BGZ74_007337 [Mortierella antarctica]
MQEMKIGPSNGREHLLRQQSGQKMKLKEKFVEIYDMFLRGQDPSMVHGKDPDVFWDELFLIKVNADYLSSSLRETTEDQLLAIKDGINSIFLHAVQTMRDPLPQRRLHAMQTLTIVLGEIFRKKFHNWSFDVIHLLTGLSHADLVFRTLVQGLAQILDSEESMELRVVALRLAIALVCGNDNVNKNSLNEYFMQKDIFSSVAKFFMIVDSADLAFEALALMGLLANYNKYETQNPYLAQLTALNDETILQKMALVITVSCDKMRRSYIAVADDDELSTVSKMTSAFSYVTGMLWNPKSQDSSATDAAFAELPDGRATILLVMYDLLYTNRRFRRVFLNFSTTTSALAQLQLNNKQPDPSADVNNKTDKESGLAIYLSLASYLFQHNRTHRTSPYTHLCLITLLILVEDPTLYPYICSIPRSQDASPSIHGQQASETSVRLCRQRQPVLPKVKQARPLGAVLLDVILGFLKHNMKKKMQIDSFRIAISIIISLASRFKSLRVRLSYHWVEMWNTLLGVVKFLHTNMKVFQNLPEARDLVAEVIDLVNYFVTYGDLIMPDPASLYALYYEIVRSGIDVFSELTKEFTISVQPSLPAPLPHHDLTSRNRLNLASTPAPSNSPPESTVGSPLAPPASHLSSPPASPYHPYSRAGSPGPNKTQRNIVIDLSNINQVHTFFFTHLLAWRDANPTRSLGPDLVSMIIKTHYQDLALVSISLDASLTLKQNQGSLGNGASGAVITGSGPHPGWDAYSEVPSKVYFFRQLTRWIVADFRSSSYDNSKRLVA